ncbi:MAG TPA: MG2 domain-containing protein, partial [Longimicrobium sp.]|nr:MG2 domain-containing protein [Longimicrobium sp.]
MSVPFRSTLLAIVLCALLAGPASGQGKAPPSWEEIEQLASEQKLDAALKGAEARLGAARGGADEAEWTKALIKVTQLRLGLHGYETAVRALREQRWPEGALARSAVELFYAHSLVAYAQGYSFEIRRRERVESKDAVDLRAWTLDQITAEAHRAYGEVWRRREALGRAPLSTWAEYLQPNNYPKGIRDTLRDAVSYLWAELLTDSGLWSPEHSNELFRLDVKALARGNPQASAKVKLEDPEVHPLARLGAILDDLEAWHLGQGRKEAALEARLARTRWLHRAFTEPEDQRLLREELRSRLSGFTGVPWWSMGQATLAELWHDVGEMFQAHALAAEGLRAHPSSVGGQKCLALVKRIEAPDFQVTAMAADGPNRRSIQVSHRNLKSLSFRAYRMDVDALVARWKDYNLLPQGEQLLALMHARKPDAEWTVALPATPDFRSHDTYVTPPLEQKGLYVLLASADPRFGQKNNRIVSLRMSLTDLVLVVRQDEHGAEARVIQGESGQPIAGADVELYRYDWNIGHRKVSVKKTDERGWTRLDLPRSSGGAYFVIARSGGQVAFDTQQLNVFERAAPTGNTAALVYTDRSIYRPLQKILWKVVAYRGRADPASYRVLPNAKMRVELRDGNGERVDSKAVVTNAFGSAVGEFTVPAGRLLGNWTIVSDPPGQASLRVEEYKR